MRDDISTRSRKDIDDKRHSHNLKENTDFSSLVFGLNGCTRYFFCNNLPRLWAQGKYNNTSFNVKKDKVKYFPIGNKKLISHWPLEYKSTIVMPIRYIENFIPPDENAESHIKEGWEHWGFLCIDSSKTNVFNIRYSADIAAAFADALFMFISQVDYVIDNYTQPNQH